MICKSVVNDLKVTSSTYQTMMQRCWDDYIMGSRPQITRVLIAQGPFQKAKNWPARKRCSDFQKHT